MKKGDDFFRVTFNRSSEEIQRFERNISEYTKRYQQTGTDCSSLQLFYRKRHGIIRNRWQNDGKRSRITKL